VQGGGRPGICKPSAAQSHTPALTAALGVLQGGRPCVRDTASQTGGRPKNRRRRRAEQGGAPRLQRGHPGALLRLRRGLQRERAGRRHDAERIAQAGAAAARARLHGRGQQRQARPRRRLDRLPRLCRGVLVRACLLARARLSMLASTLTLRMMPCCCGFARAHAFAKACQCMEQWTRCLVKRDAESCGQAGCLRLRAPSHTQTGGQDGGVAALVGTQPEA